MNTSEFLDTLLATDQPAEVARALEQFAAAHDGRTSWLPVGDRRNNSGTIQAAGDPARALVERITNGLDAVLERAHREHEGKPACSSPREAAQSWFGVPPAGLHEMSSAARKTLAQSGVVLTLLPGVDRRRRTVEVADKGLGVAPAKLSSTILSLNADNKLDKFYLAGAFGQGGSATFATSEFTVVASRSVDSPNDIGFTVVRLDPPKGLKLGCYVYLALDGTVPVASADAVTYGDYSTRIRHFGYDLDDYPSPLGARSLYGRAQASLFDPVLPFWFDNKLHDYRRTIKGSRAALNAGQKPSTMEDEDSALSCVCRMFYPSLGDFGQIGIEYWVVDQSVKSGNKAFVEGTRPIVLTVNGQTHAEWNVSIVRKRAELLNIASRLVVHVDCNKLSADAKRVLFVSNREESRRGLVQNMVADEVVNALKSDEKLQELEEEARASGLRQRDEQDEKAIRQEVARMLKIHGFSFVEPVGAVKGTGSGTRALPTGGGRQRQELEPIPAKEPPDRLEWVAESHTFFPGQRRYLRLRTNASSAYFDSDPAKTRISFYDPSGGIAHAGSSELRDGHMRAIFAAPPDAKPGHAGEIVAQLVVSGAPPLLAKLPYSVVEPPAPKGKDSMTGLPNIDIQAIDEVGGEEWNIWQWPVDDADGIASDYEYKKAKDTLVIRYSTAFPRYRNTALEMDKRSNTTGASFRKRYEIWLITSVLIHWQDSESDATPLASADLDSGLLNDYRRDELRRLSKAAIVFAQREVMAGKSVTDDE